MLFVQITIYTESLSSDVYYSPSADSEPIVAKAQMYGFRTGYFEAIAELTLQRDLH